MRTLATAAPLLVNFSSGSAVRLPVRVTWVSAIPGASSRWLGRSGIVGGQGHGGSAAHLLPVGPAQPPAQPGSPDALDLGAVLGAGDPPRGPVGHAGRAAPAAALVGGQPGIGQGQQLAAVDLAHLAPPRVGQPGAHTGSWSGQMPYTRRTSSQSGPDRAVRHARPARLSGPAARP